MSLTRARVEDGGVAVSASSITGSPSTCSTRRTKRISAHGDFSEGTYRTLTAVDGAVMVLDAAPNLPRGIEEQTRKLFERCRLRDVPIITFINKLDREGRDGPTGR